MKCSVFVGVSVDGFMARRDGRFDFLPADGGEEHGYTAFISSVDAVVMGRGTFDTVLGMDRWPFRQPVIVLTTRACDAALPPNAAIEFMSGDPAGVVARLAARGMRHLYVDGGITIQRFLDAGLIDRATITRVPVIIGDGIPLFGRTNRDIRLRHVETRTYGSGLVTTEYDIVRE
ncbi:MAG TPA: dihydrofolate reductase family protein [Gemmatimonadaceae bacterium]|nr:dihydrofolate reductase family protein [Gemmatimonadaceae bacterium]